jgi:hypothetical protein
LVREHPTTKTADVIHSVRFAYQTNEEDSPMLEQKTVRQLEKKLVYAIVEVIMEMGLKRLPLLPSDHTMQMMAKAAAAVNETAATCETREERRPPE